MTKYVYFPHFCVLLYAQNQWNEKEEKILYEQVALRYHSVVDDNPWDEKDWDEVTLYNPQKPENNPARGDWGIIHPCIICNALIPTFTAKKGDKQGFILFSHSILPPAELTQFLEFLLSQEQIKKILLLILDEINVTGKMTRSKALSLIPIGEMQSYTLTEMKTALDQKPIQSGVLYEIRKDKFY
ncbi:MAG: hypothetical protein LUQ65_09120 [Candidatus Helarchaeota archaeon]|nr:hypothetical protein [Candidatus Helarchaeota archaeon]